jgi:hypothetical protein
VRFPIQRCLGGLCALALVAAPPMVRSALAEEDEPGTIAASPDLSLATPEGCCSVAPDEMSPSAMESGVIRIQGEARPRLPDNFTTEHFILSYTHDPRSPHAPILDDTDGDGVPDYIENLGAYLEHAWAVYTSDTPAGMDYNPPPLRGGARYPVVIYQLSPGYSGQTWADSKSGRRAGSHISLDAHLSEPYVRAVAAHELFHAIQYGYNYTASSWWKEATADWAASEVFPEVDSYVIPYYDWFQVPNWSLDYADGWHEYGSSIWAHYLSLTRGREVIRQIWEGQRAENDPLRVTNRVLEGMGTSLSAQFHDFAVWNWFTGDRADGAHYPEGQLYPMLSPPEQQATLNIPFSGLLRRLSNFYLPVVPPSGAPAVPRGLTVRLSAEDGITGQLILEQQDGARSVVPVSAARYHLPDFERNIQRATLVISNGDAGAGRKFSGSLSLGTIYRDQYGYLWDLQVSADGAVHGTVDVGDTQPWTVTGEIKKGSFRWRAANPTVDEGERWVTGFEVAGASPDTVDPNVDHWASDSGRSDVWNGAALSGSIPPARINRRGPALR